MSLLEINIISAHDLPPVSKMLRTFAVAYMHPDHKLTTKVDHQGHTNPTWNYKVVFHVDDKFLKHESSSSLTIEIYNVAWLRDLPIGTTRLLINNLNPPLHKNPSFRRVSLQICRPSGHLQGTLILGVQFIQNTIPGCERNISIIKHDEEISEEDDIQDQNIEGNDYIMEEYLKDQENNLIAQMKLQNEKIISPIVKYQENNSTAISQITSKNNSPVTKSELGSKSFVSSRGSQFSAMRSLTSEVAAEMKKGLYSMDFQEYGSSIFENWTESGDKDEDYMVKSKWTTKSSDIGEEHVAKSKWTMQSESIDEEPMEKSKWTMESDEGYLAKSKWTMESDDIDEEHLMKRKWTMESGNRDVEDSMLLRTRSVSWRLEDHIPMKTEKKKSGFYKKKRSGSEKGLMSCFGNAYGFQFSFMCGSKTMKTKNRKNFHKVNLPQENLRKFYV